ncbi:hypothetical protein ACIBI9_61960 [Nonomuraea sp. NPDC050451]
MEQEHNFKAFVEAVEQVKLDEASLVHEAAHSTAVSSRDWGKPEE